MWWGYSPAVDLLEVYEKENNDEKSANASEDGGKGDGDGKMENLNILLIGCGDGRHCLQTLARRYRRSPSLQEIHLNWYVVEPTLELVARQMLLHSIALTPGEELGPLEKARLYLEIYGNTLLRAGTASFLERRSAQLARITMQEDDLRSRLFISLDALRHRERDYIQDVFSFWSKPATDVSMTTLWDRRLRAALGVRYDSRAGAFDWDYHMRFREMGGEAVSVYEYKHWRETGVAFTWLETECSRPNPTLLSWIERLHGTLRHRGYRGDITSGPFVAHGVECEDEDLKRTCNGIRVKRSTDISERNALRVFHELANSKPYVPLPAKDTEGVVITEISDARDDWQFEADSTDATTARNNDPGLQVTNFLRLERSILNFLPPDAILNYPKKSRYQGFFDMLFLSQSLAHLLSPELVATMKDGSLVFVEGKRFVVSVRKDDVKKFGGTLMQNAKECSCIPVKHFDPLKDAVALFRVQRG